MGLGRLGPTCQRLLSSLVDGSSSSRPSAHGASRLDRVLRSSNAGVMGGFRSARPGTDVEVSSSQCASIHNSRWTAWSARRELEDGLRLQSIGCIWSKFCRSVNTSAGACDIRGPVSLYRYGQLRGFASGFRGQGGRIDIGARARQNQARRLWTIAISGTLVAGFIIVVLNTFQENMMFYITPSQALEKYFLDPSKNRFRLGGLVLEGSVHHSKTAAEMEFVVTDLANEILVRYRGALPDLFREGHSVVAEGFLRPIDSYPGRPDASNDLTAELAEKAKQAGCYFTAVEVLAKHDEKYMPKEVAVAIEKNKAAQEAQQLALSGAMSGALTAQLPVSRESPPPSGGQKRKGVSQTPVIAQQYELPS